MEHFLRHRDCSSFCRNGDSINRNFQVLLNETRKTIQAQALILNTFEDLEGSILTHARSECPNIYTIGPLHAHLKSRITTPTTSSNNLWEEDSSCLTWLGTQPLRSVIYVSFGSLAMVTKDQLIEFCHGLINSGKHFLWVIRPDSVVDGNSQILTELLEDTKEKG
ncbi:7-deoxyloganetic acid glucosyltransferase [Sarracenia purpurea var. burkii]